MQLSKERESLVEYGCKLHNENLTAGTSGNLSIYLPERETMLISPSGVPYLDTRPEDIVEMHLDGTIVAGKLKPSSEWALHAAVYRKQPQRKACIHTHSMFCTIFATLHQPLTATHYLLANSGSHIVPCAPYHLYGTIELAEATADVMGDGKAVLMANHGLLVTDSSLGEAIGLIRSLEYCAELEYRARAIGRPYLLSASEMEEVVNKFKSYGQADIGAGSYNS